MGKECFLWMNQNKRIVNAQSATPRFTRRGMFIVRKLAFILGEDFVITISGRFLREFV